VVIRRGEIWWAELAPQSGRRPVLVIQDDLINRSSLRTTIIIPLTSNVEHRRIRTNVYLPADETGLPKDSVAIPTSIDVVEKEILRRRAGSLPSELLERVEIALLTVLGLIA
jgi:mRNA interferase MazF